MDPSNRPRRRAGLSRPPGSKRTEPNAHALKSIAITQRSNAALLEELFDVTAVPQQQQQSQEDIPLSEDTFLNPFPSASPVQMESQPHGDRADKRPRTDDPDSDLGGEPSATNKMLLTGLATIPAPQLDKLKGALSKLHSTKLDNVRQIARMTKRSSQGLPPHGWRIQSLSLPKGSEIEEQAIKDKLLATYTDCYEDMIAARSNANDRAVAESKSAMNDVVTAQMHIILHAVTGNPDRYSFISEDDLRQMVEEQVKHTLARAELEADLKAAKADRARAKKDQERKMLYNQL